MDLTPPKSILFDLDDTLLESNTLGSDIWRLVCEEVAERINGLDPKKLFEAIERERGLYWSDPDRHRRGRLNPILASKEVPQGALEKLGIYNQALAKAMGNEYQANRENMMRLFPGVLEMLERLCHTGIRLALITNGNSDLQNRKVRQFGLARFFDCILIEGQFGLGKPDKRVYLHAIGHLDSSPSATWMVGDHLEWEISAPQELGITGVWVDNKGEGVPSLSHATPDRIIRGVSELLS